MEYWRWWVVHLWVEGIFEVFATAIISTLFVRMGILRVSVAATMILFATMNIGLAMMTFLSLLPQGLWQTQTRLCLCPLRRIHAQHDDGGFRLGARFR